MTDERLTALRANLFGQMTRFLSHHVEHGKSPEVVAQRAMNLIDVYTELRRRIEASRGGDAPTPWACTWCQQPAGDGLVFTELIHVACYGDAKIAYDRYRAEAAEVGQLRIELAALRAETKSEHTSDAERVAQWRERAESAETQLDVEHARADLPKTGWGQ